MATGYSFHPEALLEYAEATQYYLQVASVEVADRFVNRVETAIGDCVMAPTRWRVVEAPGIRRYVLGRFPFVIYYRHESLDDRVIIFAIMHCSREPGYWKQRTSPAS